MGMGKRGDSFLFTAMVLVLSLALGACAGEETRPDKNVPQIGLRRGSNWSVMNLTPPFLTGTLFNLTLKKGVLSGMISAGTAPAGSLHVRIHEDGIDGKGPHGPIALDFSDSPVGLVAAGTWNGQRVHVTFEPGNLTGSIGTNSAFASSTDNIERFGSPMFAGRRDAFIDMIDPMPGDASCSYRLQTITAEGALTGGSICGGMPEDTRLEVPPQAADYYTIPELAAILLVILSSPPVSMQERFGPRFDQSNPFDHMQPRTSDTL
jgi:hypothetical protein